MSIIKKVMFKMKIKWIKRLDGINNAKYTKKYSKALRKAGMDISSKVDYIHSSVYFDGTGFHLISIGDYCVLSKDVLLLTHDFSIRTGAIAAGMDFKDCKDFHVNKPIKIGNNVFVGMRSVILPGTVIEDNVIIGAGSVVRGRIPANSVVVGNPCQVVCNINDWYKKHALN